MGAGREPPVLRRTGRWERKSGGTGGRRSGRLPGVPGRAPAAGEWCRCGCWSSTVASGGCTRPWKVPASGRRQRFPRCSLSPQTRCAPPPSPLLRFLAHPHLRERHLLDGTPALEGRLWRAPSSRWGGLRWPLSSRSPFPSRAGRRPPPRLAQAPCGRKLWGGRAASSHRPKPWSRSLPLCRGRKVTLWWWGCC